MFPAEAMRNVPPVDLLADMRRQIYFHLPVITELPMRVPLKQKNKKHGFEVNSTWQEKMLSDIRKKTDRFQQWKGVDRSQIVALANALDIRDSWSINNSGTVKTVSHITDSLSDYRWLTAQIDKGVFSFVHLSHQLKPTLSISIDTRRVGNLIGALFEIPFFELDILESMRDQIFSAGKPMEQRFISIRAKTSGEEGVLAFANAVTFSQAILEAIEHEAQKSARTVIENIPEVHGEFLEEIIETRALEALRSYAREHMEILSDEKFDFNVSVSEQEIAISIIRDIRSEIIRVVPLSDRVPGMRISKITLSVSDKNRSPLQIDIPQNYTIPFSFDYFPRRKNMREGRIGSKESKMRVLAKFHASSPVLRV